MAWANVAANNVHLYGETTGTTIVLAYATNLTAGSLLVCAVTFADAGGTITATCADSKSQTWVNAVGPTRNASLGGVGFTQYLFYFENTGSGADTVTVTFSATVEFRRLNLHEYTGIATSGAFDQSSGAIGNSAAPNSGSQTTTADNELIYGAAITDSSDVVAGSGFTDRGQADTADRTEDKNGTPPGSFSAAFTCTSSQWIAQMATFKEPSGAAPDTVSFRGSFPPAKRTTWPSLTY